VSSTSRLGAASSAILLLALAGCGGGDDGPPVHVSQISPADGATCVELHGTLRISLDGALDPSSVTSEHVRLLRDGYPPPVTLSYDATTHVIGVTTPGGLSKAQSYVLAVSDLKDAHGRTVDPASATFRTAVNAELSSRYGNGNRLENTLDAAGYIVRSVTRDDQGRVVSYRDIERTQERPTTSTIFVGAGADGQWFTADDVVYFRTQRTYEPGGALSTLHVSMNDNGFDRIEESTATYHYDSQGTAVKVDSVGGGLDLVIGTGDDDWYASAVTSGDVDQRGASQSWHCAAWAPVSGCVPADANQATQFTPGTGGVPDVTAVSWGPGEDGVWQTADDLFTERQEDTLDARGNVIRRVSYYPSFWGGQIPGPLMIGSYEVFQVGDHDLIASSTSYDYGPDIQWFTADDNVVQVTLYDTAH